MRLAPHRRFSRLRLGLLLASLAPVAIAASDNSSESDFLEDIPVVLTASRILQSPLDAPAPVTVIDRETILNSGFTEIHDIFRLVPGFLVAERPKGSPITGNPEGSPVIANQGIGDSHSRRLLVLLDGRALYSPFQGGVDWQDLPLRLEDIERIEVVRGPNAAGYGANAFQGIINIISRAPLGEKEKGVVLRAGKRDIGDAYAYLAHGDGDINWRISASARQATNFRDIDQAKQQYNEAIKRQVFNGQLSWNPRQDQEFSFRLGLTNGENENGEKDIANDPMRTEEVQNALIDIGWKRFYAENSEISLRYYHYGSKSRDRYSVYPTNPGIAPVASLYIQDNADVRRDDIEFQQIHAWSDTLTGLWGMGVRNDAVESPKALYGLGSVGGWQAQVFGNLDWTASPNWLIHAGGMLEKHYNTGLLFSPRVAVNYRITPSQSLRVSAGRAYRAPTVYEANARDMVTWSGGIADIDYYADRDLKPEKLDYAEIGFIAHLQPIGLQIDARIYLNQYTNIIDEQACFLDPATPPPPGTPTAVCPNALTLAWGGTVRPAGYSGSLSRYGHYKASYFLNAGEIRVHGGDLGLDWKHADWGRFRIGHAITRIRASGGNKDRDVEMSAPQHSSNLLWSKKFARGLRVSLGGYWVGEMKWPNGGDLQPAYRRLDAVLGKTLKLFGKDDELSLTLQNFNEEHTEFRDQNYLIERRAFITYRVNF